MNCDFCNEHILATTQISWRGYNYHSDCIGEAVATFRAAQEEAVNPIGNLELSDNEDEFNEAFDQALEDYENEDYADEFADVIERLEQQEPIIPEVVSPDFPAVLPSHAVNLANMVATAPQVNGSLIAGAKGSCYVDLTGLKGLPLPESTATFKPIPFYEFVTKLLDGLYDRRMRVVKDEYIISQDGMKLFGLLELENEFNGVRFAVGLRSSNDKSMKLALACGYRVMCCSNGMLSGDFMPLAVKHSASLDIDDALALGIDRIRRRFGNMQEEINFKQSRELNDRQAESMIYQAFTYGKFPVSLFRTVHQEYFVEPSYKEFAPRTLFSLENAFTTSFKKLQPMQQFEQTARLAKFLLEHRN